ncbi:MAG: hypothetical protein K2O22_04050 [Anaeroplasmataceae bacterium]|nr:hypothetical protein [Anaeroplasmataceae bacterium]
MEEKDTIEVVETENINEQPTEEVVAPEKPHITDEYSKEKQTFKSYLYGIWYNFISSFKYNPCKLPGILIALPGLFIGFFLGFHSQVTFLTDGYPDLSGVLMFILVLMGCINIANGVTVSSKKNLGSIVTASICSAIILICGVLWVVFIFLSKALSDSGKITMESGEYIMTIEVWMSIISTILAIICSVIGCVLGFIKRDRDYKKVTF